ncbi:RTA-like protein [Penicillium frequentans]|uniref:RTA-like protein n=1 Tax=Penicillium frequentans TaxID=3151616 RepID=A0AAD6GEZ9_9EURO|nr:RTA-like protein [Penicillium glabrum]
MADSTYILYNYNPSGVAAIIFIALFGLTTLAHIFQMIRSRTWFFIPFVIGGIFEIGGYAGRYVNSQQSPDWMTMPYAIQSLLLLIAPAFFAASIYMILGRCMIATGHDSLSVIPVKWLTKIFVGGDVISFLTQCAGGGVLSSAKSHSTVSLGENIIIVGLFIQIAFFGFFIVTAGIFHYRLRTCCDCGTKAAIPIGWKKCLYVLYTASVLILIRSIFRAIEYITGSTGPLMSTEVYLYVFDAALMFLTMTTFNILTPKSLVTARPTLPDVESANNSEMPGGSVGINEK